MDLGLSDQVVFVAASSRGLGRAIAREFAREGASVALCARSVGPLKELAGQLVDEFGVEAIALPCDLSGVGNPEQVIKDAEARFGRVDVLVTNTGGPPAGPFEQHDQQVWDAAVQQNLMSVIGLCRGALPGMKARGYGRILNVTSIAVKQPVDGLILSNAVRAGVTGFARSLANEVAKDGITVNNLLPGYTRTERLEQLAESLARQQGTEEAVVRAGWESEIPMGRLGSPEEFAAAAVFLGSRRASYITGQSLAVDGGWVRSLV